MSLRRRPPCFPGGLDFSTNSNIYHRIAYQRRGIAKELMERCLADLKAQGMAGVHLITAGEGVLPEFYEKYGFKKENEVILMGLEF